jgi:hypothetical protein
VGSPSNRKGLREKREAAVRKKNYSQEETEKTKRKKKPITAKTLADSFSVNSVSSCGISFNQLVAQ